MIQLNLLMTIYQDGGDLKYNVLGSDDKPFYVIVRNYFEMCKNQYPI